MKDYSGKKLSRKANMVLLVTNVVLFVLALGIGLTGMYYDETVTWVGMACVMLVSAVNSVISLKRLRGKQK